MKGDGWYSFPPPKPGDRAARGVHFLSVLYILGEPVVTTKTLRRRFFALAGRLTRKTRRLTLHLPHSWPSENQFGRALAGLRTLPLLA